MRQAMQANGVALSGNAPQQTRVAQGLVPQAEPGGRGAQVGTEIQRPLRGQRQPALVAVQGLGLVIGRAAELEPVLPIQGQG